MGTVLSEALHDGGFIASEANGHRSRDSVMLTGGAKVLAGSVLARKTVGNTASSIAVSGNTGNGSIGAITVADGSKQGGYMLTVIEPAANAGAFMVEDPDGVNIGHGTVGVAFNAGGLSFTLGDGAVDFAAGDQFRIAAAGLVKYGPLNLAATDMTASAAAVLFATTDVTAGDKKALAMVRECEVNASELVWPAGATANQIAAGITQLATPGRDIIAR
jgi:hypothetical protein